MRQRRTSKSLSTPFKRGRRPKPSVVASGRVHALAVPYEQRAIASAHGARWDKTHKVFLYQGDTLPEALKAWRARPYSLEMRVERTLNPKLKRKRDIQAPATITPRPHQAVGVQAILASHKAGRQGFLLADDVGLGKTITAWQAVLELPRVKTVLIVCPLAVVAHWRKTIANMGDGDREVLVLNYEQVGKLFKTSSKAKVRSHKGLARAGKASAFDMIIWDESHRCKNPTTARSKFAAKLNKAAGFILWLSATAGQNPLELSYLAPLLARVTGDKPGDLKDYEAWCLKQGLGVKRGNFGRWEWRGDPEDCEKVRQMLFEGRVPAGIRRRPQDIAGWPELNRILIPIALKGLSRQLYLEAWTRFRREMDLDARGKDPGCALAAILRFRQKASLLRVAGTVELARELLENGHQVAISVAFIETLDTIWEALEPYLPDGGCATIHGQLSAAEKESERLRFQRGQAQVMLFTVEEGISLHQGEQLSGTERGSDTPRSQIIHDLRWSAIQMAQIEGRCHRDGNFAQIYWTFAEETLEERIAQVVCRRIQSMQDMIGDDTATIKEIEKLLTSDI